MDYTVKFSVVMFGDTPPLSKVADAIANQRATGGVPNRYHQKTYEQIRERIYNRLMGDARTGVLKVCDQFGHHAPIAEIVKSSPMAILIPDYPEIFTLYVRQKHLADWGALDGDTFIFQDTGHEDTWVNKDLRTTLESTAGATLADLTEAVEPASDGLALLRKIRRTWRDVAWLYMTEVFNAGQYTTVKQFYQALEKKAGAESPFDRGTGQNSGSLVVREVSESLTLKTVQNNWADIKAARNKV